MRYGIRQPRLETPGSILEFARKMGYPVDNIFLFRDSASLIRSLKDPVFSRNLFRALSFTEDGWCRLNVPWTDTSYRYQTIMSSLISLSPDQPMDTLTKGLTVVITWATFLGRYNDRLFALPERFGAKRSMTTRFLFVCIDIQKSWKLVDKHMLKFRFDEFKDN